MSIPMHHLNIGDETYEIVDPLARQGKLDWDDVLNKPFDEVIPASELYNETETVTGQSFDITLSDGTLYNALDTNKQYILTIDSDTQILTPVFTGSEFVFQISSSVPIVELAIGLYDGSYYLYATNQHRNSTVTAPFTIIIKEAEDSKSKLQPEYIDLDALSTELGINELEAELETLLEGENNA